MGEQRQFLPVLRSKLGAALDTKGLSERVRASGVRYIVPGIPYTHRRWDVRKAVEEGYQGNPLVYRAIESLAQNAIARKVIFRQGDPETGAIVDKISTDPTRVLYVLNKRANNWETANIFRHRVVAQYLLSSKGVYIEVVRTRSGGLAFLNVLDPDIVEKVPLEKRDRATGRVLEVDPIGTFRIQVPGVGFNYLPRYDPTKTAQEQPSAILWLRSPHPTVMWEGMSPTEAAAISIDLDKYARLYNRRFLQNDGRPGGLIAVKGNMSPATQEQLQAQFTGGPESAGRPVVIEADQLSYVDTSATPRDMMWSELSTFTRKDIAIAFGVPESVMGDASGRTFDNADAEYAMFWEHRMLPLLRALDDQLDILTGAGYDDDTYLRHYTDDVWVLGRHKRELQDRAAADVDRGAITLDEYRVVCERDPWNVPATRVLWLPSGNVPVGSLEHADDTAAAAALHQVGVASAASPAAQARLGAAQGSTVGARLANDNTEASRLRLVAGEGRAPGALEQRKSLESMEGKESRARGDGGNAESHPWR